MVAESRGSRMGATSSYPAALVEDNPLTSVTVLFGIGLGVGFILGHTIAEAAGRQMFHQDTFTDRLTSQIRELLKNNLPQGITRHMP